MNKRRYKGFDYENHPDLVRRAPSAPSAEEGEWVYKGGGYYENTATGEVRRGSSD